MFGICQSVRVFRSFKTKFNGSVDRTNEVGVDINLAVQQAHKSHLVQFICGLGPRKGQALLRVLKQTNQRLENRTQLVTSCHMGPKVFINCSGFIKVTFEQPASQITLINYI